MDSTTSCAPAISNAIVELRNDGITYQAVATLSNCSKKLVFGALKHLRIGLFREFCGVYRRANDECVLIFFHPFRGSVFRK